MEKFFTPLLTSWKSEKLKNLKIRFVASSAQKGGKKLSEGVKNFFMIKSTFQLFPEPKIILLSDKLIPIAPIKQQPQNPTWGVRSGVSPLRPRQWRSVAVSTIASSFPTPSALSLKHVICTKNRKFKFLERGVLRDEFLQVWELSGWQSEHFLILS